MIFQLLCIHFLSLLLGSGILMGKETFFNGKNLAGWSAEEMSYWSVENGAIVGTNGDKKVPGNQFLWYGKKVQDFKLTLQVKQVPFGGQNHPVARPNGGADVFRLARLFGDDNLIGHEKLTRTTTL